MSDMIAFLASLAKQVPAKSKARSAIEAKLAELREAHERASDLSARANKAWETRRAALAEAEKARSKAKRGRTRKAA